MKSSPTNNQSSEDPRTRRRRRSSSDGRGQVNEVPPIVMRLSEACSNHKKTHEPSKSTSETQPESKEGKSVLPQRCTEDLKNLRDILSQVDEFYKDPAVDESVSDKSYRITASDISNLCVFYGALLSGSFCPHSLYLLDYGRDVDESEYCSLFVILLFKKALYSRIIGWDLHSCASCLQLDPLSYLGLYHPRYLEPSKKDLWSTKNYNQSKVESSLCLGPSGFHSGSISKHGASSAYTRRTTDGSCHNLV